MKFILCAVLLIFVHLQTKGVEFKTFKSFEDKEGIYNYSSIQNVLQGGRFCDTTNCAKFVENTESFYWIYVEIERKNDIPLTMFCEFMYQDVTAYFFKDNMIFFDSIKTGYDIPLKNKYLWTSSHAIPVPNISKVSCFLKFKVAHPTGVNLFLKPLHSHTNSLLINHSISGAILGIFLLVSIYGIILGVRLRRLAYFYYVIYVVAFWIYLQSINHDTGFYLYWLSRYFSLGYYIFPNFILTVSFLWYAQEVLGLKKNLPLVYKLNVFITFGIIIQLFLYLVLDANWNTGPWYRLALLPSFIGSIILNYKGRKDAQFVLIGIMLIYIGSASTMTNLPGISHHNRYIFSLLGVAEIICFGISMSYWAKSIVIEKEEALKTSLEIALENERLKNEQNEILEVEVAKKTSQLRDANDRLFDYATQIEEMNKLLQNENITLKVDVSDQMKARSE
ncbi:MAG TPA: 7TM-DISM domain-containing protein, partial [Cytophagaceae bacterium]